MEAEARVVGEAFMEGLLNGRVQLFQVGPDHRDDFIGGRYLSRSRLMLSIQDVTANVTFEHLGHKAVHGSPGCAHDLQDL